MAEDIVACSGCGKKFRIPDGSPPSGKFACTACGADVAWGGGGGAAARGGRPARGAKAGKGGAPKAGKASSRGARRAKGRRARGGDDGDDEGGGRRGHVPKEKENKTLPLVIAIMGAVALVGILIIAFTGEKPDYSEQADGLTTPPPAADTNAVAGVGDGGTDAADPPAGTGTEATAGDGTGTGTAAPLFPIESDEGDEDDSGIGGSETSAAQEKDYRYWFLRPKDELFTQVDPLEGTTDEEAARIRELVGLATDFDAGAAGMKAEGEIADLGRKAMPFLMSEFEKAWKGSQWSEPGEQFACFKIQQLSREIVKATRLPSDLFVRFPPGPGAGPDQYQRAARMWVAWWRGEGQYIEEFQAFEDEE